VGGSADVVSEPTNTRSHAAQGPVLQMLCGSKAGRRRSRSHRHGESKGLQIAERPERSEVGVPPRARHAHDPQSLYFHRRPQAFPISVIGVASGRGHYGAQERSVDAVPIPIGHDKLEQDGDIKIIADTEPLRGTEQVLGGPMPAGCLYARSISFGRIRARPGAHQRIVRATNGSSRLLPRTCYERSRILSARDKGCTCSVQQGEEAISRTESSWMPARDRAHSDTDLQPRSEGEGDQARAHVYERVVKKANAKSTNKG